MSEEIEQLESDIAALTAARSVYDSRNELLGSETRFDLAWDISRLQGMLSAKKEESPLADEWAQARNLVEKYTDCSTDGTTDEKLLAKYAKHLAVRVSKLEVNDK